MDNNSTLKSTPLTTIWQGLGARMVDFAGYLMPVQFPDGVMAEHKWTRSQCGLFDVSHMGPATLALTDKGLTGDAAHSAIAALVEPILPCDVAGLQPGQLRYTTMTTPDGGIYDDLFVGRLREPEFQGSLYLIVNAGCKEADFERIKACAQGKATLTRLDDRALIAVQGPRAIEAIGNVGDGPKRLGFMEFMTVQGPFGSAIVSRSGYTGEDGFEILIDAAKAPALVRTLLATTIVKPIGLGARDSLRLEAGLCLYGHDLDESISPIEAGLTWTIGKARRTRADFQGHARILSELANKPSRKRVGLLPVAKAPAREGAPICDVAGNPIGRVTSGGFGPSVGGPIAMGYVESAFAAIGTPVDIIIRDQPHRWHVAALPFVPHNYHRKG
ncbi:MAG: hypothetical protein RL186_829 [Pseudomonadota bacterium]|jgi:aminomethyltransferase